MSDLLAALKLVWDFETDDVVWYQKLAEHGDRLLRPLGATHGAIVWDFGWADEGAFQFLPRAAAGVPAGFTHQDSMEMIGAAPSPAELSATYRRAPLFGTTFEVLKLDENHSHVMTGLREIGYGDTVGFAAGDATGGLQVQGLADHRIELSAAGRWQLGGLCAHVAAAVRLRKLASELDADSAAAVFDADGDLVHSEAGSELPTLRDRLRKRVLTQRQSRDSKAMSTGETLDAWTSMVDGEYSLIDWHERQGRRRFLLFRNPYRFRNPAALSSRQRDVIALASRGQDNATIGMTLGIADSTVASHLANAMAKLGIENRTDVVRYLAWECGEISELGAPTGMRFLEAEPRIRPDLAGLTTSEREVAELAAAGASNEEIAKTRGTSVRTIANQLQSIYEKLDVNSRNELAALF